MKYYEQLLKLEVFDLNDVEQLTGSADAAKQLLIRYVEKGLVKKVKRNLYYCVNLENKNSTANRFIVGSNINPSAYLSHHSALEYHGLAHQTFYEVYVASDKVFRNFEFEDITYKYIKAHFDDGVMVPESNSKIRVTNVERTVIDCIKNIDLAGGTEELFQCLDSVMILNNERLLEYLELYDIQFLYQKAGYMFERYKTDFSIKDEFIDACQQKVGEGIRYFNEDAREGNGVLVKKWNLIIPKGIDNNLNQGVTEFV
jgi:predicted transcriptional regulator of viral defense system